MNWKEQREQLIRKIFSAGADELHSLTLDVFKYQVEFNPVYGRYVKSLRPDWKDISNPAEIPFLPIEFFKNFEILTGFTKADTVFSSSGTTGMEVSRHFVPDPEIYRTSFRKGFELFYGPAEEYCLLALLPSYMEREGSSLILMADDLIRQSKNPHSGFYLKHSAELSDLLKSLKIKKQKTILLGVTFALLDFAEAFPLSFPELIVMETGGMKGRKKEMVREEVHDVLRKGFDVPAIHSEYGMTELLSQAYSKGDGLFFTPPWMKIFLRDTNDPFSYVEPGTTGGINVIDLANLDSCAFIATQDLGKMHNDNSFEVIGRFDYSDVRGCNLLVI